MSANFQPTDAGGAYVWPDEASAEGLSGQQEVLQDYRTVKYRENVNKACESYEYFECKNLQEEQDTCEFGATKLIHLPLCQVGTTTCSCRTTLGVLDAASLAFTCLASGQRSQRALF